MNPLMQIKELYDKYINIYARDFDGLNLLTEQLNQSDQDIASHTNFVGHEILEEGHCSHLLDRFDLIGYQNIHILLKLINISN